MTPSTAPPPSASTPMIASASVHPRRQFPSRFLRRIIALVRPQAFYEGAGRHPAGSEGRSDGAGRAEGRAQGKVDGLLAVLRARGLSVNAELVERLARLPDAELDGLFARALVCASPDELVGER
ncbi:MAG: hypothetical protein U0414_36540 [Polyangiaceae bacterium]